MRPFGRGHRLNVISRFTYFQILPNFHRCFITSGKMEAYIFHFLYMYYLIMKNIFARICDKLIGRDLVEYNLGDNQASRAQRKPLKLI